MQVILTEDVKKLGGKGDVVNVADGYARNYLFPRALAVEASPGRLKERERQAGMAAERQAQGMAKAKQLAANLDGKVVRVTAKAGEGGRLFGSVTSKEIAQQLEQQFGLKVDKRKIELEEAIKVLGNYQVAVKLQSEAQARITVEVVAG